MKKVLLAFFLGACSWSHLAAQSISGQVVDKDANPIVGVNCVLLNLPDSTQITGTTTNVDGVFELKASKDKEYILHISFIGFETYTSNITLNESMDMGKITLSTINGQTKKGRISVVIDRYV